jgi:2,4-dienoyl-CoA reductase [(3E)-enoyl-CoA-producing], peroxisomal
MDAAAIARVFKADAVRGRVALITGGGSGICQEIALKLAEYGAKIAVMGRREAMLQQTVDMIKAKGHQAIAIAGDVRSEKDAVAAVQKVVETFGKLDVLVNGAAGNFLALADKLSTNAFRTVMEIDAIGTFNMSRNAFPALKQSGDACIINITATLQLPATWYQVHASAAKAAVDSITRTLALEWGTYGIRVIGVAPGPIDDTVGTAKLTGSMSADQRAELMKSGVPIGRIGYKTDIASAVLFLVSPAASFVTGDTIIVDGGHYLFKPPVMDRESLTAWSKQMEKKSRTPPKAKL